MAHAVQSGERPQGLLPLAEIRRVFPRPISKHDDTGGTAAYGVGGALCLSHGFLEDSEGMTLHFPDEDQ